MRGLWLDGLAFFHGKPNFVCRWNASNAYSASDEESMIGNEAIQEDIISCFAHHPLLFMMNWKPITQPNGLGYLHNDKIKSGFTENTDCG